MGHYLLLSITMTLAYRGLAQDTVFPTTEESPQLIGNDPVMPKRAPVCFPENCPENMLPGPELGENCYWMCYCEPPYLYSPINNTCYEVYEQGPCLPGNYIHLPEGELFPRCVPNPCTTDGLVPFNEGCYALETRGPCDDGDVLRVDSTSLKINCTIAIQIGIRHSIVTAPDIECQPGYRKTPSGGCREPLS